MIIDGETERMVPQAERKTRILFLLDRLTRPV